MKIFAHRGSSLIWPENTILAFDLAHQAGATGFETDLRLSKDGHLILSHDNDLHRFGKPQVIISESPTEEILNHEIHSIDGEHRDRLITLNKLLTAYPDKDYIFDCKISDRRLFETLRRELDDLNFHNRIWFLTWDRFGDQMVRELFPGYALFPRVVRSYVWGFGALIGLSRVFEPANHIVSLPASHFGLRVIRRGQVASLRKRGRTFVGYLVNTESDFQLCRECGIDTILTDRPDLIAQLCREVR
jgi:glycerophosphoryl diester phosphodiesterase